MVLRITDYVLSGELRNTRRNSVFGWIEFAEDYGVRIELTGNFSGRLAGKHIRFSVANRLRDAQFEPGMFPDYIENMADRQIGVVQAMDWRKTKVPALPIDEFLQLPASERDANLIEKDCLYLAWSSQDGDVVSELIEPQLEFVEDDELPASDGEHSEPLDQGGYDLGFTKIHVDDGGITRSENFSLEEEVPAEADEEDDDEDDPYGLFDPDLQHSVSEALGDELLSDELLGEEEDAESRDAGQDAPKRPSWDEIIPDLDPQTKAMYEQWDEIFEGKKDQPISYLFPKPLKLPKPEAVKTEAEAEALVKQILAQLALLSVALDVCEHFTPRQTYRLLMQEILPSAKVHPNLAASEMVQHYATSDYCQECEAEFDAEYEAMENGGPEEPGSDDTEDTAN